MMKTLILQRLMQSHLTTWGVLLTASEPLELNYPVCLTVENMYKDNQKYVSCIPVGEYVCRSLRTRKAKYPGNTQGWTYRVDMTEMNIKTGIERTGIDFHPGNSHKDTLGCILPVSSFGWLSFEDPTVKIRAGLGSRKAHRALLDYLGAEHEFKLSIQACFALPFLSLED